MEDNTISLDSQPNFFMRWGSKIFLAFTFLLPIFFIPTPTVSFQFGKGFFLFLVVFSLTIIFLLGVLKEGKITLPKSFSILGLFVILLAYLISGVFSSHPSFSLLGQGFEVDTAFFVLAGLLLTLLIPLSFRTKTALFNVYIAMFFAFFVAVLFNIIRFVAPNALSFGIFNNSVSNLVGTWNDLGIFAGFVTVLALISIGVLEARGPWKVMLYSGLVLGVVFLAIVNFTALWWVIAGFSLIFFLYSVSYAKNSSGSASMPTRMRQVSWAPVFVFIISVVFLFAGTRLGNSIANALNISQLEARPSLQTTISIMSQTLRNHPILGAGPNEFLGEWLKYKPTLVNQSVFWNVDFASGVGTVPTSFVTLGTLGVLAWVAFLVLFLFEGFRAIRRLHGDAFAHYLAFSSFVGAFYFWIVALIYTPSHAMYTAAFLFTGIFVSTLVLEHIVPSKVFDFSDHPGKSFVGSLVTIVLIIASAACLYLSLQRFVSYNIFNRAVLAYQSNGNLDEVSQKVQNALLLNSNDLFFRSLADIYLAKLTQIVNSPQPTDSEIEGLKAQFQQYLTGAIASAQASVADNKENYLNWLELARVYETVVPLKINGAYEEARKAYEEAAKINPTSPFVPLSIARLENTAGNGKAARDNITKALDLKNNYTDAVFLLAQMEVSEGNTKKAIEAVRSASVLEPTNPLIFFQLGFLQYNDRDYNGAIQSLGKAIQLQPQYANAKYFFGLSLDRLNRDSDAIKVFEDLESTNPDNAEIKAILANLRAGRSPFAQVQAPLDDKPEKRKTPPVSEEGSKNRSE